MVYPSLIPSVPFNIQRESWLGWPCVAPGYMQPSNEAIMCTMLIPVAGLVTAALPQTAESWGVWDKWNSHFPLHCTAVTHRHSPASENSNRANQSVPSNRCYQGTHDEYQKKKCHLVLSRNIYWYQYMLAGKNWQYKELTSWIMEKLLIKIKWNASQKWKLNCYCRFWRTSQ